MIVHDVDRPDVNGTAAKMQAIGDAAAETLDAPMLVIRTDDNIMSSIHVKGSLDTKESWPGDIYENSRHFRFMLTPANGDRYYDPNTHGGKVTVELAQCSYKLQDAYPFRKSTTTPDKAIVRIKEWLAAADGTS